MNRRTSGTPDRSDEFKFLEYPFVRFNPDKQSFHLTHTRRPVPADLQAAAASDLLL